jgi:hypothetical protein
MTRYAPLYQDWQAYPANTDRMLNGDLILNTTNVRFTTASMAVSQRAAGANMSVDVAPGRALLVGNYATNEGSYYLFSDAVENVVISTAPGAGLARIDLIVAQVRNQFVDPGTNSDFIFTTVNGTAAASPVAPALGTNQILLAQVRVNANVTSILTANITDQRPVVSNAAGGDLSGTLPNPAVARINGSPLGTITPATNNVLTWNGSAWVSQATQASPPNGAAGGDLAGTYPNPTVGMNLPAALGSGAPFTSFTDSTGTVWVAKGGVNAGAWRKATDVLHAYWARNAALSTLTAAASMITFDAQQYDDYGIWNPTGGSGGTTGAMMALVPGYWRLTGQMVMTPTAANQWLNIRFYMSNFGKLNAQASSVASAIPPGVSVYGSVTWRAVLNDYMQLGSWASAASIAYSVGSAFSCFFQADYMGTG